MLLAMRQRKDNNMGFSLQAFFQELLAIIKDSGINDASKFAALTACIEGNAIYAAECGQIEKLIE